MQREVAFARLQRQGSKADAAQIRDYCSLERANALAAARRTAPVRHACEATTTRLWDFQPADISVGLERLVGTPRTQLNRMGLHRATHAQIDSRDRRVANGAELAFDFEPPIIGVHPERRETSVSDTCAVFPARPAAMVPPLRGR